MAEQSVNCQAYCKILLHSSKYPHCAVNGVLLAERPKNKDAKHYHITDAIPLFHLSLTLAPMMEVALTQVIIISPILHIFLRCHPMTMTT